MLLIERFAAGILLQHHREKQAAATGLVAAAINRMT